MNTNLRSHWRTFAWIFALSLVLRIVVAWFSGELLTRYPTEMMKIAKSVVQTGEYADPYIVPSGLTAHSPPLFPLLLAGLLAAFDQAAISQIATSVFACIASALRCGLVPLFALDAGLTPPMALVAGVISVFYIGALQTEVNGSLDGPYVALALLGIVWMSLRLWRSRSWQASIPWPFFLLCGLSVLLNPQVVPVLAALLVLGWWQCAAPHRARFLKLSALLAACMFLILLPWGIRNWIQLGSPILTRSNLGMELWIANGPGRTYDIVSNARYHPDVNPDEANELVRVGEVAYNREKMQQVLTWIRENPQPFAHLAAQRFVAWWFPPGNIFIRVGKALLTLFAFAGLWILLRGACSPDWHPDWRPDWRLTGALFACTFLTFPDLFYVIQWSSRYRLPMDWELIVCASVALVTLFEGRGRSPELP